MDEKKALLILAAAGGLYLVIRGVSSASDDDLSTTEARVMRNHQQIWSAGVKYVIDPAIIASVIHTESAGRSGAKGAAGEVGLMQIMPATAAQYCFLNQSQLEIPSLNILCGTRILAEMMRLFSSVSSMISAYNAGPGRVGTNPDYVVKVGSTCASYRRLFESMYPSYAIQFPAEAWSFDVSFFGLGDIRPRLGYRYNVQRYQEGNDPPGACPVPPRGGGYRVGTRQFSDVDDPRVRDDRLRPRWGYRYNIQRYAEGRDPPGACPVPPRGGGYRVGTRWIY